MLVLLLGYASVSMKIETAPQSQIKAKTKHSVFGENDIQASLSGPCYKLWKYVLGIKRWLFFIPLTCVGAIEVIFLL